MVQPGVCLVVTVGVGYHQVGVPIIPPVAVPMVHLHHILRRQGQSTATTPSLLLL
jgi:hypothetical protein